MRHESPSGSLPHSWALPDGFGKLTTSLGRLPLALGYGAYYFGLPDFTVRERLLVFAVSALGFFHSEMRQWENWRQTAGKTGMDFFAKVTGVGLGLALVNYWWK